MAIVSVLWSLGLLTVISVSLMWNGTIAYRLAHNTFDIATINATAEAAVSRAVLAIFDLRPERRWRTDGSAHNFEFNGIKMKISIQDELGRIDLNQADAGLLIGLLRAAGLDQQAASALVDKIIDWREAGSARRLNGAKDEAYREAGLGYRPRNGAFQSVDELLLVMDMTPALFARIEPALTVYSGRQFIDPQVAPREALAALPTMDPARIDTVLSARASQAGLATTADQTLPLRGRAFAIRTEFDKPYERHRQTVTVRLTDDPAQPYWVLNWRTNCAS